jgi:hypothetical protein
MKSEARKHLALLKRGMSMDPKHGPSNCFFAVLVPNWFHPRCMSLEESKVQKITPESWQDQKKRNSMGQLATTPREK